METWSELQGRMQNTSFGGLITSPPLSTCSHPLVDEAAALTGFCVFEMSEHLARDSPEIVIPESHAPRRFTHLPCSFRIGDGVLHCQSQSERSFFRRTQPTGHSVVYDLGQPTHRHRNDRKSGGHGF